MRIPPPPTWHAQAACKDVPKAVFFDGPSAKAKQFCQECPVVSQCLDEAMANPQLLGVWGGTTDRERAYLRRRRAS